MSISIATRASGSIRNARPSSSRSTKAGPPVAPPASSRIRPEACHTRERRKRHRPVRAHEPVVCSKYSPAGLAPAAGAATANTARLGARSTARLPKGLYKASLTIIPSPLLSRSPPVIQPPR